MKDVKRMVEFKSPSRIIGGEKGSHCHYPVQIDHYGNGCENNCVYCYAHSLLGFRNHWNPSDPAESDISKIRKIFSDAFDKDKNTKWASIIKKRIPVRIGGMTDPFTDKERYSRKMMDLLEVLWDYDYPCIIFTKNALVADPEYIQWYGPSTYIQLTITSLNQDLVNKVEPNASSTLERLDAAEILHSEGVRTGVRIAPIIPMAPDGYLSKQYGFTNSFNYFTFDLVRTILERHPDVLIGEMCRFTPFIIKQFNEIGVDVTHLLNENSIHKGSTTFLSVEERKYYYRIMQQMCNNTDTVFSVCELDHFEEFEEFHGIPGDCCGLKGTLPGCDNTWNI